MIHRITIPDWRPARLNELLAGHWQMAKLKKRDREFVAAYARHTNTPLEATGKRRVSLEITLTGRQKETDPDAYWKSLNDALVHAGLLIDDSSEWCELGTVSYNRDGKARTVIVLEDL